MNIGNAYIVTQQTRYECDDAEKISLENHNNTCLSPRSNRKPRTYLKAWA